MTDLLGCPFCGGSAWIDPNSSGLIGENWPRGFCGKCAARGPVSCTMNDENEAAKLWNTRPQLQSTEASAHSPDEVELLHNLADDILDQDHGGRGDWEDGYASGLNKAADLARKKAETLRARASLDIDGVERRLKWHMPTMLRWLAENINAPRLPDGTLTGRFLYAVAENIEARAATQDKEQ